MMLESLPAYSEFASGPGSQAYNETTFRHFLAIERRRAECSMRAALLILVTIRRTPNAATIPDGAAAAIFRGLGDSIREVDFAGWFRQGRVIGALLAQSTSTATDHARQLLADRVMQTLKHVLPAEQSKLLSVRVIRLAPRNQPAARASAGY
jgi:hypothetical protein